jgi:hypothetical protein
MRALFVIFARVRAIKLCLKQQERTNKKAGAKRRPLAASP